MSIPYHFPGNSEFTGKWSLTDVIFAEDENDERINQTLYTQPALFAVEYALAQLWRSWGIEPGVVHP